MIGRDRSRSATASAVSSFQRDVVRARKVLLGELALGQDVEKGRVLFFNEPLDLVGVDLGRHGSVVE